MANKIPLVESFGPTIQGEGIVVGMLTHFLRFGGCDYRCTKCDSLHAVIPEMFANDGTTKYLTPEELNDYALKEMGDALWVTLSGGNPCMWDLSSLIDTIHNTSGPQDFQRFVALETQGTLWQDWILECDVVTISPKGPGMGIEFESDKFQVFIDALVDSTFTGIFNVKIPVFSQQDLDFAAEILDRWPELEGLMFLSVGNWQPPAPAERRYDKEDTYEEFVLGVLESTKLIVEEVLQDPRLRTVRVLPQLHTLIWGNGQGF